MTLSLNPASLTPRCQMALRDLSDGERLIRRTEETAMSALRVLGDVAQWCVKTVLRVAGLIVHRDQGVDPNGADYLYKPRPPEYRP